MAKPGDVLKRWRDARDLSQHDAAQLLDPPATQGAWASWENGKKPPSLANALEIARLTRGVIQPKAWVPPARRPKKRRHKPAPPESSASIEDCSLHGKAS